MQKSCLKVLPLCKGESEGVESITGDKLLLYRTSSTPPVRIPYYDRGGYHAKHGLPGKYPKARAVGYKGAGPLKLFFGVQPNPYFPFLPNYDTVSKAGIQL